ncbi:Translation initiation factor 3 [Neofusicoccum parvum]|uniref:Putative translation initiation factor protein n=1 Tax=Botryosphaeria parva (strain UCR-NP2) TaxID=1287680 RepID=R1EGV2_BOTPV|nr:putative translation initiation factor protein [Neofusicoccum parvum UCRNP2]GME66006.1 Translation initiation factor 3 [Neofusicoccum parvum]
MAHARHVSYTTQALFRVFVQPTLSASTPRAASRIRPSFSIAPTAFAQLPPQRRTAVKYRPPVQRKTPYDEAIGTQLINLVDQDGVFQPGVRLRLALASFDRTLNHLVQVGVSPEDSEYPFPVCKVMSKSELREQERAKAKQKAKKSADELTKTIELNWAVDQNDLQHWLKRLREFLEDGRRVEVVMGPKKRGRKASPEEAQAVLDSVKETVAEIKGSRERAQAEGEVGGIMTMFFEGPEQPKEEKQKEEKVEEENEDENKPKVSRWKIKEEERRKRAAARVSPGIRVRYNQR